MIKAKQMEELRRQHAAQRELGKCVPPSFEQHVLFALVSGQAPQIRTAAQIADAARRKIVSDRYNRSLAFTDVFASCKGYERELKAWNTYEKKRLASLAKYEQKAAAIFLGAHGPEADAVDVSEQLREAAIEAGMKELDPPVFPAPGDTEEY